MMARIIIASMVFLMLSAGLAIGETDDSPSGGGWVSLFNGTDMTGWRVSEAAAESWSVIDGVIDCDPRSRLGGDRNIWTEEAYGDFILHIEWRIKDTPTVETWPVIGPDGNPAHDDEGNAKTVTFPNADSGIYLRGSSKAQVNIWNWPIGSGEVWGYRTDRTMPDDVRAAVTPMVRADNPVGQWNSFVITMIGDRLSVLLNGRLVINNAQLPGVDASGKLALQYHGGYDFENEQYRRASSLVQFRNIFIKPLD